MCEKGRKESRELKLPVSERKEGLDRPVGSTQWASGVTGRKTVNSVSHSRNSLHTSTKI